MEKRHALVQQIQITPAQSNDAPSPALLLGKPIELATDTHVYAPPAHRSPKGSLTILHLVLPKMQNRLQNQPMSAKCVCWD